MADDHAREELAQLRTLIEAQRAEFAAYRTRHDRPRRHSPRRLLPLALVALLVALTPLALLAAGPTFSDLDTAAPVHQPDIQAIGDAGITTGFEDPNDPTKRLYNPKGLVTREEMASFLARTAGLGANPPVAHAKTAQTATSATNATTVGGFAPDGLVRVARGVGYPFPGTGYLDLTATFQTITTVTITAPAAGFVLLTGSANFEAGTCAFREECPIEARLRDVGDATPGGTSPWHYLVLPNRGAGDLAFTYVFPVNDAGAKSYIYEARGDASVDAYSGLLTALFVPFGHDGGTTLAPTP